MTSRLIVRPETEEDISGAFKWNEGKYPGLASDYVNT